MGFNKPDMLCSILRHQRCVFSWNFKQQEKPPAAGTSSKCGTIKEPLKGAEEQPADGSYFAQRGGGHVQVLSLLMA